jgi:hypothetical protein
MIMKESDLSVTDFWQEIFFQWAFERIGILIEAQICLSAFHWL